MRPNSETPQVAKSNIILGDMQIVSRGTFVRMGLRMGKLEELSHFCQISIRRIGIVPRGTKMPGGSEVGASMMNQTDLAGWRAEK